MEINYQVMPLTIHIIFPSFFLMRGGGIFPVILNGDCSLFKVYLIILNIWTERCIKNLITNIIVHTGHYCPDEEWFVL